VPVTVEIESPDLRLKPGMNATCDFITARKRDVLKVPLSAIQETDAGSTVTVMEGGQQKVRPVEVGLSDNDASEIISGLSEGETIITGRTTSQRPGASAGGSGARGGGGGGGRSGGGGGGRGGGGGGGVRIRL